MNTAGTLVLLGTVTITAGATATHYLNGDDGTVTANVATALGAPREATLAGPGAELAAAAVEAGGNVVLLPCPSDAPERADAPAGGQLCAYLDTSPEAIAAGVVPGGPPPGPTIGQELAGVVQSYAVSELSGNAAAVVANQIGGPLGNVLGAGVAEAIGALGAGGGFGDLFGKLAFRMAETYALGELDKSPFGRQVAFAYRAYGTVRGLIGFVDSCSHSIVQCVAGAPVQVAAVSDLVRSIPYAFPAPEPEETWTFAGEALPEYTLANLDPATAELLGIELDVEETRAALSIRDDVGTLVACTPPGACGGLGGRRNDSEAWSGVKPPVARKVASCPRGALCVVPYSTTAFVPPLDARLCATFPAGACRTQRVYPGASHTGIDIIYPDGRRVTVAGQGIVMGKGGGGAPILGRSPGCDFCIGVARFPHNSIRGFDSDDVRIRTGAVYQLDISPAELDRRINRYAAGVHELQYTYSLLPAGVPYFDSGNSNSVGRDLLDLVGVTDYTPPGVAPGFQQSIGARGLRNFDAYVTVDRDGRLRVHKRWPSR